MNRTMVLLAVLWSIRAAPALAADDPRCLEEYQAEVARIGREAERRAAANPAGRDLEAQRQFMIPIEKGLREAADRADQCSRKGRGTSPQTLSQASAIRAQQCNDLHERRIAMLGKRGAGSGGMSAAEQDALRAERLGIEKSRAECLQQAQVR